MRKLIISLCVLMFSLPVFAQHRHFHHHHNRSHWNHNHNWIVPAIIGGAVVYAATRPDPIIVQQPAPVILNSNQVYVDGVLYTKQIIIINGIQQEVLIRN